jgi:hypothetical protein
MPWGTMLQAGRSQIRLIEFFNLPNPSSRTVALGSTQPLTEMSTSNLLGGKGRPGQKADDLIAICEPIFYKIWEPRRLTVLWASSAYYRDSFTFFTFSCSAYDVNYGCSSSTYGPADHLTALCYLILSDVKIKG